MILLRVTLPDKLTNDELLALAADVLEIEARAVDALPLVSTMTSLPPASCACKRRASRRHRHGQIRTCQQQDRGHAGIYRNARFLHAPR